MLLSPKKIREIIVQFLFSFEMGGEEKEELIAILMNELKIPHKALSQAFEKSQLIWNKQKEIDEKIVSVCNEYDIARIGKIEKSVIRLGIFELFYEKILPKEIIISEAIRLNKKFSTKEGSNFVNAILDSLIKNLSESPISS